MRPHIIVIHRWRARYAEYERYLDHDRYAVSYLTTEVGATSVPPQANAVVLVAATDDLPSVSRRVDQLAAAHGRPASIIALKEDDLLIAAQLRAVWGCPGPRQQDLLPFRDKLVMARAVAGAGLPVPAFAAAPDVAAVRSFADRHGWPVVVKPRLGSSSAGVSIVASPADCAQVDFTTYGAMLVQAFDPRQIYHVDGFFDGTTIGPLRATRYLNSCVDFRTGAWIGGAECDDASTQDAIRAFAERVMAALSRGPTVFHLEVFVGEHCTDIAFLEVGGRAGGGDIPFLWREVHGWDLMEAAFAVNLDQRPPPWRPELAKPGGDVAGWLLVPAPARRPCRITEIKPMLGRVPGLYAEALLDVGEVLPDADAYYEHVGGRFRFRGRSTAEVARAITMVAENYQVRAEPLG